MHNLSLFRIKQTNYLIAYDYVNLVAEQINPQH